ncbi:MAG: helix-turn-helix domain-containing protein [Ruminococcaceae bacterium]|nr:helix-turn-helix domain-containing protein [Oscillospiraceae bacterium]
MFISDKEKLIEFSTPYRIWQGIPSVERTKSGRLFCTFYSGMLDELCGNYSVVIQSDDDGENWTEPVCAAYAGETHRCFDPTVWIDPLGRLWFFWCLGHEFETYAVICEDPDADELKWSEEFFVGYGVMLNKPTVLSGGEWLFPICVWDYWSYCSLLKKHIYRSDDFWAKENFRNSGANVHISTDNGKTITYLGGCSNMPGRSYDESMIFEKKNGALCMLTRTTTGTGITESYDRGITWVDGRRYSVPNPSTRFHVRRLNSGRLLMINHHEYTGRNNLTAMLSEDDGATWPYKLLLDGRDTVSYPDAIEGEDGWIYVIYDRERAAGVKKVEDAYDFAREILIAKINEQDILCGEFKTDGGYTQKIVNKLGKYEGECVYSETNEFMDSQKLADELSAYDDTDRMLAAVFAFYPISCRNMHCVDVKKMDEYIDNIKTRKGSVRQNLINLAELLNNADISASGTREEPLVDRVISYIQENITQDTDISSIARELNVSTYYLCHVFKRKTKLSIIEYRNVCRFSKAKKLLVTTDDKITDIAMQCGFGDYSFFIKKFRQSERISPTEYRRLNKIVK